MGRIYGEYSADGSAGVTFMIAEKGVTVVYSDIALGAKEAFEISAPDNADISNVEELQQSGVQVGNYENPIDGYGIPLDGSSAVIPSFVKDEKLGYWSEQTTDANGYFSTPIVMTFVSKKFFTTEGVMFTFDDTVGVYCNDLNIKWYSGNRLILSKDFQPDESVYSCASRVNGCDKIVVTFKRLNSPYDRLRIRGIEYGRGYYFYGRELKNVTVTHILNPLSTELSISTADITMSLRRDDELRFKDRQPISTYFNGKLQSHTFVKKAQRTGKSTYNVNSEDYISLLDSITYKGGIYGGEYAVDVLKDIFKTARIPYSVSGEFKNERLYGHIPYGTCRNALMQVCFAIGAVVDTAYSNRVNIYALSNDIKQTVPKKRIKQGQSFGEETKVTAVSLTYHAYHMSGDEAKVLYDADKDGVGNNILVKFSAPKYALAIDNGDILERNANYAILNARQGCKMRGSEYLHLQYVKTKYVDESSAETENVISISNATLISAENVDKILDMCYNELKDNNTVNMSIVEGKHVIESGGGAIYGTFLYGDAVYGGGLARGITITYDPISHVGDVITAETEYLGNVTGRITRQTFNLNGNIVVKDTGLNRV